MNISDNKITQTPVKQNAIKDQQLRDKWIIGSTPGLNQNYSSYKSISSLNNSGMLKNYLRELSSVLVNLDDTIRNQNDSPLQNDKYMTICEKGNVNFQKESCNLFQESFSNVRNNERRKLRKINNNMNLIIHDSFIQNEFEKSDSSIEESNQIESPGIFKEELDSISGSSKEEALVFLSTASLDFPIEIDSSNLNPMSTSSLKYLITSNLNKGRYTLPQVSLKTLQSISLDIIKLIAAEVNLNSFNNSIILDRSLLLQVFSKLNVISKNAKNQELFDLSSKYLSQENIDELEIALFL